MGSGNSSVKKSKARPDDTSTSRPKSNVRRTALKSAGSRRARQRDMFTTDLFRPNNRPGMVRFVDRPENAFLRPPGSIVQPTRHLVQPTGHLVHPTGHLVHPAGHLVQPTGHFVQSTGHLVQPTGHLVQPTGHLVQPTGHLVQPTWSYRPALPTPRPPRASLGGDTRAAPTVVNEPAVQPISSETSPMTTAYVTHRHWDKIRQHVRDPLSSRFEISQNGNEDVRLQSSQANTPLNGGVKKPNSPAPTSKTKGKAKKTKLKDPKKELDAMKALPQTGPSTEDVTPTQPKENPLVSGLAHRNLGDTFVQGQGPIRAMEDSPLLQPQIQRPYNRLESTFPGQRPSSLGLIIQPELVQQNPWSSNVSSPQEVPYAPYIPNRPRRIYEYTYPMGQEGLLSGPTGSGWMTSLLPPVTDPYRQYQSVPPWIPSWWNPSTAVQGYRPYSWGYGYYGQPNSFYY